MPCVQLEAVKQYGDAPEHAAPEHNADSEKVFEAVEQKGVAFQYALPKLKARSALASTEL